jgi:aminomethyltransferase
MSLYGHDLGDDITPLEANLRLDLQIKQRRFYRARSAAKQKEEGLKRKLVGFEMIDKGIARDGFDVYIGDKKVGFVTSSGSPAPFLKKNIGLAFVPDRICKCRSRN